MTTLGQAYVQIMPSAKGISGSIQKTLNPEATAAGRSAGSNIASAISESMSKAGSKLTKSITLPVAGAMTAVTGLVTALGFKRLVGMDNARAKLEGMGYAGKNLENVMNDAREAVTGTTMTMAEGVDIAAGALAAGVEQGAELEHYIKLVGSAAVGANRPVDEMAQIFNRVQGGGRLMTQELNMIEMGLPGFAQTMANELSGGSMEAFREMVTNGEVGSQDFLKVMDGFAGGMADAYAGTWSGMAKNVLSNIGIIGEALIGGLFEDGKAGLANFLEVLRSDELKNWAKSTGESIRSVVQSIIEKVREVKGWWDGLSAPIQDIIKNIVIFGGIAAIAIGPVIMTLGKLITSVMTVSRWFGLVKAGAALVSGALGAIATPVLIVAGVIAGLIALFVALYQSNEGFRDLVLGVWETIKETISTVIQAISDFVMEIVGGLMEWWNENSELIMETMRVVWETIQNIIMSVLDVIVPIIKTAWEGIKNTIESVWNVIKAVIETAINLVKGIIKTVMQIITGDWRGAWETIKSTVSNLLSGIRDIISNLLNAGLNIIKGVLDTISSAFSSIFGGLFGIVSGAFGNVVDAVSSGITSAYETVTGFAGKFLDAGKNIVSSIADGIKGAIGKVTDAIGNVTQKIRDFLPFSPPKTGPLIDIMDVEWGSTIGAGIESGEKEVAKAMDSMLDFDLTRKATFSNPQRYNSGSNNVTQLLVELIDAVREGKNIIMDDRIVGNIIEPHVTENQERNKRVRERFA